MLLDKIKMKMGFQSEIIYEKFDTEAQSINISSGEHLSESVS